ncbi:MAG TPA: dTDP-4-dehydrorhamnose reductase [Bryobacteraceae bacterium]|nr:dTDP-4-dehydrorhamnose reductase [Bryobacteraceae bacterium]
MALKAMVFGKAGQLGSELVRVLTGRGCDVTGLGRNDLDVTDKSAVEHAIAARMPDLVLNATAYNMVDVAEREPEAAFAGNALAVRNIAVACRQAAARLVHFSTDYVFDGEAGRPYTEADAPHPLGAYAVSKLAGELFVQAYLDDYLIIRTSGVFGLAGLNTARGNFVETMLRLAQRDEPIRVVEDFVASPTYAPPLAERTALLVERGLKGIFHAGGGVAISWFEFAKLIFSTAGMDPELRATNAREHRTPARRPRYSALANARMEAEGILAMPPLTEALTAYMEGRAQAIAART